MFLLWHPSLTAINLSYTFPILETSATALCGTTGITSSFLARRLSNIQFPTTIPHVQKELESHPTIYTLEDNLAWKSHVFDRYYIYKPPIRKSFYCCVLLPPSVIGGSPPTIILQFIHFKRFSQICSTGKRAILETIEPEKACHSSAILISFHEYVPLTWCGCSKDAYIYKEVLLMRIYDLA